MPVDPIQSAMALDFRVSILVAVPVILPASAAAHEQDNAEKESQA